MARLLLASVLLPVLAAHGRDAGAAEPAPPTGRPVSIRVSWGGGKPRVWSGSIGVEEISGAGAASGISDWRPLSSEADVAATLLDAADGIRIADQRPHGGGGVEIVLPQWRRQRLSLRLVPDGDERRAVAVSVPLADAFAEGVQQSIDRDGNRLVIRAAPGDSLRASVGPGPGRGPPTAIFRPGDTARVTVEPLLPRRAAGTGGVELRLRLKAAADADPLLARGTPLVPLDHGGEAADPARSEEYEPVSFDVPLPQREGVYDIDLEAVERGGLRWSRQLAARTLQVVVVSDAPPDPVWRDEPWRLVHELDPGSPRLHERLRRLPAAGLAAVPVPKMSLPQMPLPSMSLPHVSLPQVPLPKLPAVPVPTVGLPNVAAMVPRFSGLLATGHSTIEAHPLGPMLRLPPARSGDEPTWEGIVIAGVQPGLPHLVEIEHPLDRRTLLAVSVLEAEPTGTRVEVRAGCGIAVDPGLVPAGDAAGRLGRHAFIFWPVSRNPLLLVANPSTATPAMFGRVRVSAGPLRPPASGAAEAVAEGRRVHAFLPAPEFGRFGAVERTAAGASRPFADWRTFLTGAARAAEWTAAQAAAGTMVVAYREGGAIWPSRITRGSSRWDAAAGADMALDAVPKDILGLLCRIHSREGLRLLPAVSFDAPLPDIEQRLAGEAASAKGLVVVGRDGRPRRTEGGRGWHYNPLDPRVQDAVAALVDELAARLRGEAAVDGAAIVLPHDGWMHLPGIATGLDDATFSRFLADTGGQEPAALGDRFARRAALVEGPLKEAWLEWRGTRIAAFLARLAGILTAADPRFTLHVVPTTLLVEGDMARRFRPRLAAADDADFWHDIGVDPGLLSAHPRIVFVGPQVHAAGDSLLERTALAEGAGAPECVRGIARASRRAAVILERPVRFDCGDVVPHGPFGTAAAPGPVAMHFLPPDAERCRGLAEALAVSDVEAVFDMRLLLACLEPRQSATLAAFAALPPHRLDSPVNCPQPLIVREGIADATTRVCLANAGPVACRAEVAFGGAAVHASDAVSGTRMPPVPAGVLAVPLGAWEVRTLAITGAARVTAARAVFEPAVQDAVAERLSDLRHRRAAIETPRPLEVLDNPGFELGAAGDAGEAARAGGGVSGWDLVDPARGRLAVVPGADGPTGRAVAFSSENGLATLRSNPFPPPANGRISIAVWLRIAAGDPQPPVRLAIEGVLDDREYYRFAPVGGLGGGKPLSATWSQFVLQIDDLPSSGLDSLRVRIDLLGPGGVQLDGVRVFDLAFDESQRAQLSRRLDQLEARLAAGDVGACVVQLDAYWPRFLAEHVPDAAVAAVRQAAVREAVPAVEPPGGAPVRSSGVLDRFRRWWQ